MTTSDATPKPTGRRGDRDGTTFIVFQRTFDAPIADVWAAVTEPERLVRWIGTWTGDPARGEVSFRMTAEGEDVAEERIVIDECREPTRLAMRAAGPDGGEAWVWQIDLTEADGVTTLTFAQEVADVGLAESIGPGWDYYLDRMVAAETGGDPSAVDFEAYYPAFSPHYRAELSPTDRP